MWTGMFFWGAKTRTLTLFLLHFQQLKRQATSAQEKVQRLQRHQAMKREAAEIKLKKLREEYNAISDERANVQLKIDQNRNMADDMEQKVGLIWL